MKLVLLNNIKNKVFNINKMDLYRLGSPRKGKKRRIGSDYISDLEKKPAESFIIPSVQSDQICAKGNDVYFHSPIDNSSAFRLNMVLKDTIREMQDLSTKYNIPPPRILLHINSPGGIVFGGLSIVDTIKSSPVEIHSVCEGAVASAATFISVSCKKRFIRKHAFMLIHQVSGGIWGKMDEIMDESDNIKRITKVINDIYLSETKMTKTSLNKLLKHDLWLSPDECIKKGLVDEIID